jgi:DNA-binding MarR family transcriptional regulator
VTRAQLSILARLDRNPDLTQKELAAIAEVSPMTIGRLIDCLERDGLVERCSDAADRRIWRLRLTPKAAPLLREIKRIRAKLHSVTTKGIEPAVLEAMTLGLQQMKKNVVSRRLTEASP